MPIGDKLVHPLAIVLPGKGATEDEFGQPVDAADSIDYVMGNVQPKFGREVEATTQGGPEVSDHVIFLPLRSLPGVAWIRDEPDAGRRFDVVNVRPYEFGQDPHLEVDVRLVGSSEGPLSQEIGS